MKIITDKQIDSFKSFLKSHNFFFIIGHKEPDGDCIYSCLAMACILKKLNLEYQLLSAGPFKRNEIASKAQLFTAFEGRFLLLERIFILCMKKLEKDRIAVYKNFRPTEKAGSGG